MTNKKKASTSYLDIAIPENIENMQLPSPELLTFIKILKIEFCGLIMKSMIILLNMRNISCNGIGMINWLV